MHRMDNQFVQVQYNQRLGSLEKLLSKVRRDGDFFVHGNAEAPIPKLEVDGAGIISFPVPEMQVRQLIQQAVRAPYGRGKETILDTSVRKVWQLQPAQVHLSGKSWDRSFQSILDRVAAGLGCARGTVSAELYKMLVYDSGGFFAAHRDTEKVEGMFGTVVLALPCMHRGGEIIIHHAGRKATVDLSAAEISELSFAAFYADCKHEVKPIVEGNRVCLIYNLLQSGERNVGDPPLTAPLYKSEAAAAAKYMAKTFNASDAPAKIAWLLEHQYSPEGLSFAGLKNVDAARAKVFIDAAAQADLAAHLGIVHIEESGPAQPISNGDFGYGGYFHWQNYYGEEVEEEVASDDFEVIEVSDSWRYIGEWVDTQDRRIDFGKIPLDEGELLPRGALDDEEPDEQRLTEATGNEGASFERSYYRAALVLWPQERFADVLLQSGVSAVMPYLKEKVEIAISVPAKPAARQEAVALARRVIEAWEITGEHYYDMSGEKPSRAEMLRILGRLGDAETLEQFASGIVTREYDGSENTALAAHVRLLKPARAGRLFCDLADANAQWFQGACINLLTRLLRQAGAKPSAEWATAFLKIAAVIVDNLEKVQDVSKENLPYYSWHAKKAKPVDAEDVVDLLDTLTVLDAGALREQAVASIIARQAIFDLGKVVVPALASLHERNGPNIEGDDAFLRLWQYAVEFLLARGEHPPEAPKDWRQDVKIPCNCEDCHTLNKFAQNAEAQVGRFSIRKDRRRHLHQMIQRNSLDMTHVTERKGSPYTLVCTKTRSAYQRECRQYNADILSFEELIRMLRPTPGKCVKLVSRMVDACIRAKSWGVEGVKRKAPIKTGGK